MKKITTKLGILLLVLLPVMASAQPTGNTKTKTLYDVVLLIVKYFNMAVTLIIGLAVVLFVWNIYRYFISGSDNVESKKEAGKYVMWSIIGFFVILSFWGIVNILVNTLNFENNQPTGFFGIFRSGSSGTNSLPSGNSSGGNNLLPPGNSSGGANLLPPGYTDDDWE